MRALEFLLILFFLQLTACICGQVSNVGQSNLTLREAISVLKAEDSWGDNGFPLIILEDWPREWMSVVWDDIPNSGTLSESTGRKVGGGPAINPDAPTRVVDLGDRTLSRKQVIENLVNSFGEYDTFAYGQDCLLIVNKALVTSPKWMLNKPLPPDFAVELTCSDVLLQLFRNGGMFQDLRGDGISSHCPSNSFEQTAWTPADSQTGGMRDAVVAMVRRADPSHEFWYMVKLLPEVEPNYAAEDLGEREVLEWVILRQGNGVDATRRVVAKRDSVRRDIRDGVPLGYRQFRWEPGALSEYHKTPTPAPTETPAH